MIQMLSLSVIFIMAKPLTLISPWKTFVCGFSGPTIKHVQLHITITKLINNCTYGDTDTCTIIVSVCVQVDIPQIMPFIFYHQIHCQKFRF